jgi:hypothetical protein
MKIKAKIYEADMPNANGIMYPKEELEKAVAEWNNGERFVTYEDYTGPENYDSAEDHYNIDPSKVAGKCELNMEGNFVVANIDVNDTSSGKMLIDQLESPLHDVSVCLPKGVGRVSNPGQQVVENLTIVKIVCAADDVNVGENLSGLFKIEKE